MQKAAVPVVILSVYVWMVYSRIPEYIDFYIGSTHLALILMVVLLGCSVFSGYVLNTLKSFAGIAQILFTVWMCCCIPLSVWPGGSFKTLVNEWISSFITFIVAASLISTLRDSERLTRSVSIGVVTIIVLYIFFHNAGSRAGTLGTMGNPNLFALQLLIGMPFCLYGIYRSGFASLKGAFYCIVLLASLYLTLLTGSRSGLIAVAFGMLMLFFRSRFLGKVGIVGVSLVGLMSMALIVPTTTLDRYRTLVTNDSSVIAQDREAISALDSAAARRHHLEQSIKLTLMNPIHGVGPGQFRVAAADLSQQTRERAAWLETHNSWTQVSSETGFPGILLYLGGVLYCVKGIWSLYRKTRKHPEYSQIADLAFCLLLSFVITIINMTFASAAYQIGMPMLCGLAVGLLRASENALQAGSPIAATVPVQPMFQPKWRPSSYPASRAPIQNTAAASPRKNPWE